MLYKYCPPTRQDFFSTRRLRITQPGAFNDPFDVLGATQVASRAELAALPDAPEGQGLKLLTPEFLAKIAAPALEYVRKLEAPGGAGTLSLPPAGVAQSHFDRRFGCLTLSKSPRSIAMWAYYADNHKGFVIELDPTHPLFVDAEASGGRFGEVIYNENRPANTFSDLEIPAVFFTKSREWEHEKESRLILPLSHPLITQSDVVKDGYAVFLIEVPSAAVRSVIFGARCSAQTMDNISRQLSTWPQQVLLRHARVDDVTYRLNVWPAIDEGDREAAGPRALTAR